MLGREACLVVGKFCRQCSFSCVEGSALSFQNLKHFTLKLLRNLSIIARNKYLLTLTVFAVWMVFFDTQDLITTHFKLRNELNALQKSRSYYLDQIDATKKELDQLKSDPETLEKYAREKYLMKKDNEDLFIVSE